MAISNENEELECSIILPEVTQSHPWLICNGTKQESQIFFSISKNRYYEKNIAELANKKILSNCKEWLALEDYDTKQYSLLNIISKKKIKLPKVDSTVLDIGCNLTCPPDDPNCLLVFIKLNSQNNISIFHPGDDKYINIKVQPLEEDDLTFSNAACFDGILYATGFPSLSLIRGNLNDEIPEFHTVISGKSIQKELLDVSSFPKLVESCGEILMVLESDLHEESCIFSVFRAQFTTSKWILLKNIGDRAIFFGPFSSQGISCSSSEFRIRGNCIYYVTEKNRTLYIFNMDDQSCMMTIPCPGIDPINVTPQWVTIDSLDK